MEQVKKDISIFGEQYPVLAIFKGNRLIDYSIGTENRVVGDETGREMTLIQLLNLISNC